MPRSRNIKPGFFKNEELVKLPFEYRLLFVGLWLLADRAGRMEDRPGKIRMEIFPADPVDVEAGLQALHDKGFVLRYAVDKQRLIQILAWAKHQNPHIKEAESNLTAPCLHDASTVQAPESPERAGLIPDSGFLTPDSVSPDPSKDLVQATPARTSAFDQFWAAYPIKKGKQEAAKSWAKQKLDSKLPEILRNITLMMQLDDDWARRFIPMASTYLNQRRWDDEPKLAALGKQMQGLMALEAMRTTSAHRLPTAGDPHRPNGAVVLEHGAHPSHFAIAWPTD